MTPSGTPLLSWGWLSHSGDESEHVLLLSARPALDCLRDMRRLDAFTPRQIGERPRQLQHPVIRPRSQVHRPASRAGIFRVAVTTARAWGFGPRPDQHKIGREGQAALRWLTAKRPRSAAEGMVTILSSKGCRSTSKPCWPNSGISSAELHSTWNSTPRCARPISPGRGHCPPPTRPACEMVWCGAARGRGGNGSAARRRARCAVPAAE